MTAALLGSALTSLDRACSSLYSRQALNQRARVRLWRSGDVAGPQQGHRPAGRSVPYPTRLQCPALLKRQRRRPTGGFEGTSSRSPHCPQPVACWRTCRWGVSIFEVPLVYTGGFCQLAGPLSACRSESHPPWSCLSGSPERMKTLGSVRWLSQ